MYFTSFTLLLRIVVVTFYMGTHDGSLYLLFGNHTSQMPFMERVSLGQWCQCLSHPHEDIVHQVVSSLLLLFTSMFNKCLLYLIGKTSWLHCPSIFSKCIHPLDLIQSDVWSASPIASFYRHKYLCIFIDDYSTKKYSIKYKYDVFFIIHFNDYYSRFFLLFPIKCKYDVFQVFVKFQKL